MYRRQFEAAANACGWTTAEMTFLVLSLREQALDMLQNIPGQEQSSYKRVINPLEMRYGHSNLQHVYQTELRLRTQTTNNKLQSYAVDIGRLVNLYS